MRATIKKFSLYSTYFVVFSCLFTESSHAENSPQAHPIKAVDTESTKQNSIPLKKTEPNSKVPEIIYDFALEVSGAATEKLPTTIKDDFEGTSLLIKLKDRPLYSRFAINKRIAEDTITIKKILFYYGYYDANVDVRIADKPSVETLVAKQDIQSKPPKLEIIFEISLGDRYYIKTLSTIFTREVKGTPPCLIAEKDYDVDLRKPFTADEVLDTFSDIRSHLGTCGYPFANIVSHKVVLDRPSKTVAVTLSIDQGPFVKFGVTHVKNTKDVPDEFIKNRSPLKEGDPYDQNKVDAYQDKLSTTKLFKSIRIQKDQEEKDIENGEAVDMNVTVKEGPPRTITAGVKFGTGEGLGGELGWVHRNIFGKADRLKVETHIAQNERSAELTYNLPDFLKVNQTLQLNLDYTVEKRDAYRSNGFGTSAVLRNTLENDWYYSYGLSFENTAVEEKGTRTRVGTIGVPLGLGLDRVNNILNPTSGYKFDLTVTPEFGKIGDSSAITRSILYGSYHVPLDNLERNTISFWSRLGLLFGSDSQSLPANRRFYGGGSGSVRGYARDFLSPVDTSGAPIGGKSLFEFGVEPRFRINKEWGFVTFLEGGVITETSYPSFNANMLFGAGIGLRYYTSFGPIRADLAFPFKRRTNAAGEKVDSALQFYISIGQAF